MKLQAGMPCLSSLALIYLQSPSLPLSHSAGTVQPWLNPAVYLLVPAPAQLNADVEKHRAPRGVDSHFKFMGRDLQGAFLPFQQVKSLWRKIMSPKLTYFVTQSLAFNKKLSDISGDKTE